jgi:hypothetical protein
MQICDLEQWPPSGWVTTGSSRLIPDSATSTLTAIRVKGKSLTLSIEDRGKHYSTAFELSDDDLAKRVARTIKGCGIGKVLPEIGKLKVVD